MRGNSCGEIHAQGEVSERGELLPDRQLHCGLSREEFSMIRWAANRTQGTQGGPLPLGEFYRLALFKQIRSVVQDQVARGKSIPPNIAQFVGEYFRGK